MVGDDSDLVPFTTVLDNLVGDGTGLCESWDILSDGVEGDFEGLRESSGELGLGLVTDDGEGSGGLGLVSLDSSRNTRVDTSTKSSVRGDGEVEDFRSGSRGFIGFDLSEEFCSVRI